MENAESYDVVITVGEENVELNVTETTLDLREYSGKITIAVTPVARTYNSPEAAVIEFTKTKLATPANFEFKDGKFTWSAVTGAASYMLKLGNIEIAVNGTEYVLTEDDYAASGNADTAAVKAVGEGAGVSDSDYTAEINIGEGALSQSFRYSNGKLLWDGVYGATGYSVKIDGEEVLVNQNVN